MMVISVDGVAVELGDRLVVEDADLQVHRGELVGLIGPNGAGKTTLLRTILGLLTPVAGEVRAERPIGYVPQRHEFAWDFPITVADTVMTGLSGIIGPFRRPRAEHWLAVRDALSRVGMTDLADRPIGQLSGGQRQRVLVARALALDPSALLLDEPFTGLDMPAQEMLARMFADLAHEGRAVLMTTHDLLGAFDVCDRIALINRTIVADGTPAELSEQPEVWSSTFGVGPDSPLLRVLGAA